MKYVLVENENIVGNPTELPINWANISNFHLFDNEKLKQYGWYPFRFVESDINSNQFYDGSDFVIEENEVVEYQKVRNKTPQEIENEINDQWTFIRYQRNELLTQCDWTQLSDVSESIRTSYQSYRQDLRDISSQSDPFSIVWPEKP